MAPQVVQAAPSASASVLAGNHLLKLRRTPSAAFSWLFAECCRLRTEQFVLLQTEGIPKHCEIERMLCSQVHHWH